MLQRVSSSASKLLSTTTDSPRTAAAYRYLNDQACSRLNLVNNIADEIKPAASKRSDNKRCSLLQQSGLSNDNELDKLLAQI